MSNNMRWRYGDTNPVKSPPVDTAYLIEIGDLVYLAQTYSQPGASVNIGDVAPASLMTWTTNLQVTQQMFKKDFLGVAMQQSRIGDTDPIRVATEGVFEFDCASTAFKQGDLIAPAKQSGNLLENQKVALATDVNGAIGRAERTGPASTKVLVRIFSTQMGSVHTNVGL